MKGCRPLSDQEISLVTNSFTNKRNKLLFVLGLSTGFRISELLSLKAKSVFEDGKPNQRAILERRSSKGKVEGRSVALNAYVQELISEYIKEENLSNSDFLFASRKGNSAITRKQGWKILKDSFKACGITGKVATHSLRKTVAKKIWDSSGHDLVKTKTALGHRNIQSTISYIAEEQESVDLLVTNMDMFK